MVEHTVSEGDGPVNALDGALRKALEGHFPRLKEMSLVDYKVRVINARAGTAARVRVVIESKDDDDVWGTVGVSENVIEASWLALVDAFEYKLSKDRRERPPASAAWLPDRRPDSLARRGHVPDSNEEETAMAPADRFARTWPGSRPTSSPDTSATWPRASRRPPWPIPEDQLWIKPFPFGNSIGHLVLHLTGNLNHYIGALVAGSGYVRHREHEFTDPTKYPRDEVLARFQRGRRHGRPDARIPGRGRRS